MKTDSQSCARNQKGFSLVEVLITIALLTVIAAVGIMFTSGTVRSASDLKLAKDVATINSALHVYDASGGSIAPNTAEGALSSLKRQASDTSAPTLASLRGLMLDQRLVGVSAVPGDEERAVWNPVRRRFEIQRSGDGFVRFELSNAALGPVETDDRKSSFALGTESGWVWDYTSGESAQIAGPARPTTSESAPETAAIPDDLPQPSLKAPLITLAGGEYSWTQVNSGLVTQLVDANPQGLAQLYYAIGSGPWTPYTPGAGIPILSGQNATDLRAYAASDDIEEWGDSPSATASYQLKPRLKLLPPLVSRLSGTIRWTESRQNLSVKLTNPNSVTTSRVMYRLSPTQSWREYRGESIPIVRNPQRVTNIDAYTKSIQVDDYEDSASITARYETTAPLRLVPPVLSKRPGFYSWASVQGTSALTLSNPNPAGSSTMFVSVNGGAYLPYAGEAVPLFHDGFDTIIRAYSKSLNDDLYNTSMGTEGKFSTVWFSGAASGAFTAPKGDAGMVSNLNIAGSTSNNFKWGTAANGSFKNELTFTGASLTKASQDVPFKIGTLTYKNGSTLVGTNATEITMAVDLNFTEPSLTEKLSFKLQLISTVNGTGSADRDADFVKIGTLGSSFKQKIGGQTFYLTLQFGSHGINGFTTINSFHTHEGKSMTGDMYGVITTTAPDGTVAPDETDYEGDFGVEGADYFEDEAPSSEDDGSDSVAGAPAIWQAFLDWLASHSN